MFLRTTSLLILVFAVACGDDKSGETETTSGTETTAGTTDTSTTGTTDTPTTGTTTGTTTAPTTDGGSDSDSQTDTGGSATASTDVSTGTGSTTGGDAVQFDRFTLNSAAGPCPPNADCDGFVELLGSKLLRVEKFGEVGNPVTEVEISEDDFAAAVAVFTDPELVKVLDGPEPPCQPPTDIFESMELELDGALHEASTTACGLPPLTAAREMATSLQEQYAP